MPRPTAPLERATTGLVLMAATTAAVVLGCFLAARNASQREEETLLALADDVVRVSQAEVAAERMVAIGRAYLLTAEPELLARARAAGAKLENTLQGLQRSLASSGGRKLLDPSLRAAGRYRDQFEKLLSGPLSAERPGTLAEALRTQLLPARDELEADLQELIGLRQRRQAEIRGAAGDWATRATRMMLVLGLSGAVASALLAWSVIANLKRLGVELLQSRADRDAASRRRQASPRPVGRTADDVTPPPRSGPTPEPAPPASLEPRKRRTEEPRWWPRP